MDQMVLDDEKLNTEIRKFLKKVGITSQKEIERAIKEKLDNGELQGTDKLASKMVLMIPALDLEYTIDSEIELH